MRGEVFRRPPGDFINEPPARTYRNVPPSKAMTCATIDDPRFMTLRLPKGLTPPGLRSKRYMSQLDTCIKWAWELKTSLFSRTRSVERPHLL
jgi:hypothetical protein